MSHLVEENDIHLRNITHDATPYWSGHPIDACLESDEDEKNPTFIECKKKYQSIVGSIGWLAHTPRHPAWPRLIPFCQLISTNLPEALSILPFTSFITSIQQSTMVSHSLWRRELPSTHICPSPTHLIPKHTTMHYRPVPTTITV